MNYFYGISIVAITALIATFLGQIPYRFINQEKSKKFREEKKRLKAKLKQPEIKDADDGKYENIQKQIIKINFQASMQIMIPLITQFTIIIFTLNKLRILNPIFLWLLWYIGFSIIFNRMWKKLQTKFAASPRVIIVIFGGV